MSKNNRFLSTKYRQKSIKNTTVVIILDTNLRASNTLIIIFINLYGEFVFREDIEDAIKLKNCVVGN